MSSGREDGGCNLQPPTFTLKILKGEVFLDFLYLLFGCLRQQII